MAKCGPMGLERKTSIPARLLTQTAGLILGLSQNPSQQLCLVFYCQRKGECIEKFGFFFLRYMSEVRTAGNPPDREIHVALYILIEPPIHTISR